MLSFLSTVTERLPNHHWRCHLFYACASKCARVPKRPCILSSAAHVVKNNTNNISFIMPLHSGLIALHKISIIIHYSLI